MNTLQIKLAAIIVHLVEMKIEGAHCVDEAAVRSLLDDPEVSTALKEMEAAALLPVGRSDAVAFYLGYGT